ncbi:MULTISPECIES: hypothetical protein [unclassified Streptomyces]|uniref:hypothetical protein n=1 Tax=unclassified Streptomyces TaxID=2593676 RepID=UPI00382B2ED5
MDGEPVLRLRSGATSAAGPPNASTPRPWCPVALRSPAPAGVPPYGFDLDFLDPLAAEAGPTVAETAGPPREAPRSASGDVGAALTRAGVRSSVS